MKNVNRVFFCKSLSLVFLVPSFTRSHIRFTYSAAGASSPNRAIHCMASDSPQSGDGSVSSPPNVAAVPSSSSSSSASSAIDFLSLCTRLKVSFD
jgi:putative hydrolase of HD superfamily